MSKTAIVIGTIIALVVIAFVIGRNYLPVPDFSMRELSDYRTALEFSTSRPAQTIKKQLLDGPTDLQKAEAKLTKEGIPIKTETIAPPENQNAYPPADLLQ